MQRGWLHLFEEAFMGLAICFVLNSAALAGTFVVMDGGTVKAYDAKTGAYRGTIGSGGAKDASSDGEIIAVLGKDGTIKRYDAKGAYRGQIGGGKAISVQVTSGLIIVTYRNGSKKKYDARTGAYKGSL